MSARSGRCATVELADCVAVVEVVVVVVVVVVVLLVYPNVAGCRESPWRHFLFVFFLSNGSRMGPRFRSERSHLVSRGNRHLESVD